MVDREARDSLSEATRHFVARLTSNFTFDDAAFSVSTSDRSVTEIRDQLWTIYDDLHEHRLEGKWAISEQQRRVIARAVMFLKSDVEYSWPVVPRWYRATRPLIGVSVPQMQFVAL